MGETAQLNSAIVGVPSSRGIVKWGREVCCRNAFKRARGRSYVRNASIEREIVFRLVTV